MVFDFDGVVVDSEPVHLAGFQQVLEKQGITLSREDYYANYLGCDDYACFLAVGTASGITFSNEQIAEMTAAKTLLVQEAFTKSIKALPGATELIRLAAGAGVPLAICSGALREEIRLAARTVGIWEHFATIVSAEDVAHGKPDPEGFLIAIRRLCESTGLELSPQKTVVVEDSPAGIDAAKKAGMAVLAVTTSYSRDELAAADRIVSSLAEVSLPFLKSLLTG